MGSFISGNKDTIFWAQRTNSLWLGFSLPMFACKMTSEFFITSFSAFLVRVRAPAFLHSFTELGIINVRPFANISRFVLSGTVSIEDAKVSLSFGMALIRIDKNQW